MNRSLSFHVLGPLSVQAGGRGLAVPGGRQRVLLAALLVKFNQVVSVEELVDRIWDATPPHRPRRALHTCLTRLRHATENPLGPESELIRTSHAGYMIELPPENLDLARFTDLLSSARAAARAGDPVRESEALRTALGLWRGRALPDVASDSLHREVVPRLNEQWMWALERRAALGLAMGRHHELVAELRALTFEHPFHEPFWRHFMLALYRCGRRVEALMAYGELTVRIRDEFGVDPSAEVRALHLAILRDDERALAACRVPAPRTAQ
ncbi:AfsR/SARP family transcriptional regulator [Saccharopolyspora sp. NFXS83]|uniref:AfsR/SARP family transcriptional regulator n=1 Tax=Saccharopolyspora sp. NFXS83 TaxID=2993560 RepID=UPI00224B16A2|nr:AfsR/SARP family transcriptional regulator [Saccharopolyspora sp. NFXS83]MCX2734262.1 AfsR/SARP family transcriptional regulator [Saccharopolyspora sp. NFXS83]